MNLSPQKSKTINDYIQNHSKTDTDQTASERASNLPHMLLLTAKCSNQDILLSNRASGFEPCWLCYIYCDRLQVFISPPAYGGSILSSSCQPENCGIKRSVLAGVTLSMWWSHGSLFSNPLLCPWIILSLTYTSTKVQSGGICRIHIFNLNRWVSPTYTHIHTNLDFSHLNLI